MIDVNLLHMETFIHQTDVHHFGSETVRLKLNLNFLAPELKHLGKHPSQGI